MERGVTLIPELDVPGHSSKLVSSYPQVFGSLSSGTIDFQLPSCVAGVKTLISEMLDVFQSATYFHIGGDESGHSHLPAFPGFVAELNTHVRSTGRTTLMWEGFGPGTPIPQDILVLNWESSYFPPDAMLQAGFTVINAGWDPLYVVDHYPWVQYTYVGQKRLFEFDPYTFGHVAPGYPASSGITVPTSSDIPGAELCWWEGRGTHAVPILRHRVPALAAILWNVDGERDFGSFKQRFATVNKRLESILFPVHVHARAALQDHWKPRQLFEGSTDIEMRVRHQGTIRYTLDGTQPTDQSTTYSSAFPLNNSATVMAALFETGTRIGSTTRIDLVQAQPTRHLTT